MLLFILVIVVLVEDFILTPTVNEMQFELF